MVESTAGVRSILHVDMDAFFASVEVRDDPSLAGRPVLVGGGGRRGVVAAASYEARRFGCHSAQPTAVALRRCPDAVLLEPRHDHYVEVSRQIFEVFREFSPLVEGLSLDEAFLDLSGTERLFGPARAAAEAIQRRVRAQVQLGCSVGVAANKFVAKIASAHQKPAGLTEVPAGSEQSFLAPLAIGKLWGVGPKMGERLAALGVRTIGDLTRLGLPTLRRELGDAGERLHRLSLGLDERPVTPGREAKSVSCEQTFEEDLVGEDALHGALLAQSTRLADRLAHAGLAGRRITLKIRDISFTTQTRQLTRDRPTRRARDLYEAALELLEELEIGGRRFRLIGIGVSNFAASGSEQLDLLAALDPSRAQAAAAEAKGDALQAVMTSVRDRFGSAGLFPAGARSDRGTGWASRGAAEEAEARGDERSPSPTSRRTPGGPNRSD